MAECAVIFDVDGVLLQLTGPEEELFFHALSRFVPTNDLSRDWNSYSIRNDENIIEEILLRHHLPLSLVPDVTEHYISTLQASGLESIAVQGAADMLATLQAKARLGIATANLLAAAKHRLQQARLWAPIADVAFGADGGGHKSTILGRAITKLNLPPDRIVYIGDNTNDVEAGLQHGVHFIGFSEDADRCKILTQRGAKQTSTNHLETTRLVLTLLA